ncbi:hypothetical protein BDZ94DRAFT_1259506 [Collybia nuda]|uniref:Uncharacterized protein n=1 Tax=Collybia nuda TaxID=64659 RepID=A0A9P5Y6T0_9AGAR|nr:hypothetical protein BDZ94DRAFT_1259506 [Collybia nuda]
MLKSWSSGNLIIPLGTLFFFFGCTGVIVQTAQWTVRCSLAVRRRHYDRVASTDGSVVIGLVFSTLRGFWPSCLIAGGSEFLGCKIEVLAGSEPIPNMV